MKYLTNYIIIIIFFVILAAAVTIFPQITQADIQIIEAIQDLMKDQPLDVPLFIANFGYSFRLLIPTLILSGILYWKKQYISAGLSILIVQSTFFFSDSLKNIIMRPRPPMDLRLCPIDNYSFPSGHSLINMCYFGICIYLLNKHLQNRHLKNLSNIVFGSYILFVGYTRLWLGVHFPTDIIGGYLAGLFLVYIFAELDEKLQKN